MKKILSLFFVLVALEVFGATLPNAMTTNFDNTKPTVGQGPIWGVGHWTYVTPSGGGSTFPLSASVSAAGFDITGGGTFAANIGQFNFVSGTNIQSSTNPIAIFTLSVSNPVDHSVTVITSTNINTGSIFATNLVNFAGNTNPAGVQYFIGMDSTRTNVWSFPNPVRTYSTNVTLSSATTLLINFSPPFADTSYTVSAPNELVAAVVASRTTSSFTLNFTSATLSGVTIEGVLMHQ